MDMSEWLIDAVLKSDAFLSPHVANIFDTESNMVKT